MSEEWGPWIEHDGSRGPVGKWVLAEHDRPIMRMAHNHGRANGNKYEGICMGGNSWQWGRGFTHVKRYRVRRPKALQQLIQMVENLPTPSKQYEDA